jgi:hypothetical protein
VSIKTIQITQKEIKSLVRYQDGKLYWLPRGYGSFDKQFAGKEAGCFREKDSAVIISFKGKHILIHRAIWVLHNGEIPEGMEIDHINQDPSDNRIENLRICLRHENLWNTKRHSNNKSGIKGVFWNPLTETWRARISVNKVLIEVGSFKNLDDAKQAIDEVRMAQHGKFANKGYMAGERLQ